MKILVVSDCHGRTEELLDSIVFEEFDMLAFLGDYVEDGEYIARRLGIESIIVKGNGDFASDYNEDEIIEIEGVKIFLTHGHLYNVRNTIDNIYYRAKEVGAHIGLFGHTHIALNRIEEGIVIMNPGSPSFPRQDLRASMEGDFRRKFTYGVIRIGDKIETKIIEI